MDSLPTRARRTANEVVEEFLERAHDINATLSIRHPDKAGAFPDDRLAAFVNSESLLVIPDTNILLQDVASACRRKKRLALVNAANIGAIRLFCAQHVIEEVSKHGPAYAASRGVQIEEFVERWNQEYRPLLRTIADGSIPETVLIPSELARVRRIVTSKDVPSVILAMTLGAFFLSKDKAAWEAIYGRTANVDELERWLEPVYSGNDADEIAKFGFGALILPTLMMAGTNHVFKKINRVSPWAFAAVLGAMTFAASRVPRSSYASARSSLGYGADMFLEFKASHDKAINRFLEMQPPSPSWEEISQNIPHRSALLRACVATLARSPQSHRSANELSKMLPYLGIPQGANVVRELLRENPCFMKVARGRWQLGAP